MVFSRWSLLANELVPESALFPSVEWQINRCGNLYPLFTEAHEESIKYLYYSQWQTTLTKLRHQRLALVWNATSFQTLIHTTEREAKIEM